MAEADSDNTQYLLAILGLNRTEQLRRLWQYYLDRRIDCLCRTDEMLSKRLSISWNKFMLQESTSIQPNDDFKIISK